MNDSEDWLLKTPPGEYPVPGVPGEAAGLAMEPAPPSRRQQLFELAAFIFLILPSLLLSFFAVGGDSDVNFFLSGAVIILRDLALMCLIFFFLWRNGERLQQIGLRVRHQWREVLAGALLFIPTLLGAGLLQLGLEAIGLKVAPIPLPQALAAHGPGEYLLAMALVVVVALSEETIFRGYLILRLRAVTRSTVIAVVLSTLLFALGHGYQGSVGVITVGYLGLVFALVYLWRKSLVAPIVMHFLQDFMGIILLPLLGLR